MQSNGWLPEPDSSVFIVSHPSHELAAFGLLQRLRPHLVVLTDGGRASRMEETREGLARAGLADRVTFFEAREDGIYAALLEGKWGLLEDLAGRVASVVEELRPTAVFCDATEFYNPVHDVTLPITVAGCASLQGVALYEISLIHQGDDPDGTLHVQRLPHGDPREPFEYPLRDDELAAKLDAADRIYSIAHGALEPVFAASGRRGHALEHVATARRSVPQVVPGQVLRFEVRGRLLREQGAVEEAITYADHYAPFARSCMEARGREPVDPST